MEDFDESLIHALRCGSWFDVSSKKDPWVMSTLSLCIDKYIGWKRDPENMGDAEEEMITIERLVTEMVQGCLNTGD